MKIRKTLVFLLLILTGLIYLTMTFKPPVDSFSQKEPSTKSEINLREKMEVRSINFNNNSSNYIYFGNGTKVPIIFVHGTPGSSGAFFDVMGYKEIQESFDMVSIDRLGWNTSYLEKGAETDFKKQVEYIKAIKDQEFPEKKPILVGHSLGGSIIPKALMDYPDSFSGMVIVAGTIDPNLGKPRWYNYLANSYIAKFLISEQLQKSNDEIMALKENLEEMSNSWSGIQLPVSVIQGTEDFLVSPKNADFAKQKLSHLENLLEVVEIEGGSHFLIWEEIETIKNSLLKIKDIMLENG